jgi:hypothetical protein
MSPWVDGGGSHDKCAPSGDFEILMADGAPGNPGKQVLNGAGCKKTMLLHFLQIPENFSYHSNHFARYFCENKLKVR